MDNANEQINPIVVRYLPHLVGAPAILARGWLVARALARDCPWGAAANEY
jgi:hypothetical protein